MTRREWTTAVVRLVLGLGLLVVVLWWLAPSWQEVAATMRPRAGWLALGLLGTTLGTAAASRRWQLVTETLGQTRLSYATYFHVFAFNRVLAQVLPSVLVDLVGRGVTLRAAGSTDSVGRLSALVMLERVLDLCLPLALLGLWLLRPAVTTDPALGWSIIAVGLGGFALAAAYGLQGLTGVALALHARLRPKAPRPSVPRLPPSLSRRVVALTLARYGALVVQFWGFGRGVGAVVELPAVLAASTVAQLASIIAITPGGLGFAEGGWAAGLAWQSVRGVDATLFILASRLGMAAAFGLLTAVTWRFGRPRPSLPEDTAP